MSIQQTTQLIQLILNSVLMLNAAAIVLGILMLRHGMLHNQLRSLNQDYVAELEQTEGWWNRRLLQAGRQLRQLQQHHRSTAKSVLCMQCAVATFAASTLLLTLRTIISLDGLIACSLWLVVAGILALLAGLGLALLDFYRTGRLLEQDVNRGQRRFPANEPVAIAQTKGAPAKTSAMKNSPAKNSPVKPVQEKRERSANAIRPLSYSDADGSRNLPPLPLSRTN